jgi:hypothetical protein
MTLRVEFAGQDHPVGRAISQTEGALLASCAGLVAAARRSGAIPPGPPPQETARAYLNAIEAVVIELAKEAPHDADLAEMTARGLLGLPPEPASTDQRTAGTSTRAEMEDQE